MTKLVLIEREKIDAFILQVEKDAGSLQNKIHRVAVSILKVWHDAKDAPEVAMWAAQSLTKLQGASPYHRNAFSKWVAEFTPLLWAKETGAWYRNEKDCRLMGKAFIAARDMPFWKLAPAPEAKPFDLAADIEKLLKRAEKHLAKPVEGDAIPREALKYLREAIKTAAPVEA